MEIRIMRGTLDTKEIWAQTFLFCRMARLAKNLTAPIPMFGKASNRTELGAGLVLLLNACGIHGKMRRYLVELSKKRLESPNLDCFCYNCHEAFSHDDVVDIGLSRSVCEECFSQHHKKCIYCGMNGLHKLDNKIQGGRWVCENHNNDLTKRLIMNAELQGQSILTSDGHVGSGFTTDGIANLDRIRKLFISRRRNKVVKTLKI